MELNLDPGGGGPLDGCSVAGCAFFLDLGSEMTGVTSSTGTMYWGLRFLTLFIMVLKEVSFLGPSSMVLKEPFLHMFEILWPWGSQIWVHFWHTWCMVLKGHFYLISCLHGGLPNGLERSAPIIIYLLCTIVLTNKQNV